MRVALKFAYAGRDFHGYARQPGLKTVEGEILKSLIKNRIIKDAKEGYFRSASRTDKGVSALSNVVAFNTEVEKSNVMNKLSNKFVDILIYGITDVEADFNPRYAKFRQYRYYLNKEDLDVEKIVSGLEVFVGKHDFSNFARVERFKKPVRTIYNIVFREKNNFFIIDFFAQNFLWHQIRRIVSALLKLGLRKIEREEIINALDHPDESIDFGLAPAEPLILKDIFYGFKFEHDPKMLRKVKKLEEKLIHSFTN